MTKKTWQTPHLEAFGNVQEMTRQLPECPPVGPKLAGAHDSIPCGVDILSQCPPGQFPCNGAGGTS